MKTPVQYLIRCLSKHRQSHQHWADWAEKNPGKFDLEAIVSADYQRKCVARYDRLIAIVRDLAHKGEQ